MTHKRQPNPYDLACKCHHRCVRMVVWLLIVGVFVGCGSGEKSDSKKRVTPAFYHWKTNLEIDEATHQQLKSLEVEKLYVKFFDVDWNSAKAEPIAMATLQTEAAELKQFEIIPTIFITNRTFVQCSEAMVERVAFLTAQKFSSLFGKYQLTPTEIQFDCDWTQTTREKYFHFLERFKKHYAKPIQLSATIRLHQIKYFHESGTPPVDRGMLMFYNMSKVSDWETQNSILDLAEAEKYLTNFDEYSLPLDVVLPAYSWGVLFRDSEMIRLLPGVYETDFAMFEKLDSTRYRLPRSSYFQNHYLYENDRVRHENVDPNDLLKAARLLTEKIENPTLTVGFYHLHQHSFEKYSDEMYRSVLDEFRTAAGR